MLLQFDDEHYVPQAKEACFTHANVVGIRSSLQSTQYDDWESSGVFQCVRQVLSPPAHACALVGVISDPPKLYQALS